MSSTIKKKVGLGRGLGALLENANTDITTSNSNANTGNVPGGGWHLEALKYFNKQMKAVREFREKEEKDGYPNYTLVQNLIKINNDIKMDDDGDSVSKKQKREEAQPDKSAEVIDLMFIDE